MDTPTLPDSVSHHWSLRFTPAWLHPYIQLMRLDRPIGWWLLLWPCWWSVALAALADPLQPMPNITHLALFMLGAIVMRGAGCTYNDIIDRDIDAQVTRTQNRPLPSGRITPLRAAIFMLSQALIGLAVLLNFNTYTIILGLCALIPVALYPFMKRITNWPQAILGIAFSWGALMGWSAYYGQIDLPPLLLFAGCIAWTLGYDTIYAFQDEKEDAIIGVKSTAQIFKKHAKLAITLFYSLMLLLMALAFWIAQLPQISYNGLAFASLHALSQIIRLNPEDPDICLKLFREQNLTGWFIFLGLMLGFLAK